MKPDKYLKNYINGQLLPPISGEYIDNYNPATGEIYSYIPDSGVKDVEQAIESAQKAQKEWASCGVRKRFRILARIADIIEQNVEAFAIAESIDTGKNLSLCRSFDVPRAHSNIRFFANAVTQFSSEAHPNEYSAINYTLHQPMGIVACLTPWNAPLQFFTWKVAPALAVGNCVIAKPSELAPMTTYMFAKACIEAGLPAGVLNIIHGNGPSAGQTIIEHSAVRAISFTGGTKTGRDIALIAAAGLKKVALELGGKNSAIIFEDCDFEKAVVTTLQSAFQFQGQKSVSTSRIFIQSSIYEQFKEEFIKRTQFMKIGDPMSNMTNVGPLISEMHREKIMSYIALAKMESGKVLTGGDLAEVTGKFEKGYFVKPTILEGLSPESRTNQEEIFGPIVTLLPFETEEEVIATSNKVKFGLAATLWTKDVNKALRVSEQLEVGMVWVNDWQARDLRTPYGGIKQSGIGREGGLEALRFFTESKNVNIQYGDKV